MSFFGKGKWSGGSGAKAQAAGASPNKKNHEPPVQQTPLEKMLMDAGPIRGDGSDKFFGMENFGNTCYCNSILQCLFYSKEFREKVVEYPVRSQLDFSNPQTTTLPRLNTETGSAVPNGPLSAPLARSKTVTSTTVTDPRRKSMQGTATPGQPGTRPEDSKDSPEYKKKAAMLAGPILAMDYANSKNYGMPESIFTALKDIFENVMQHPSRTGVVSPQKFVETLKRENELFRSQMHQDAHEFLNYLLNQVVEKIEEYAKDHPNGHAQNGTVQNGTVENGTTQNGHTNGSANGHALASKGANKTGTPTSWVHDLFEGTLTSETKCLTCENVSQRDETFLDLSIDLEKHSSVTSCLRNFSQSEMLCERNKFHCDKCGGLQEAEKRMKVKRAPRILALHLKRFKYTEDLQRLTKLFHRVVYPYHLRLFNTTDDAEDPDRLYELYAVVVHIGGGPYHGHYVSIIKTEDRGWLLFDDEMVEPVDKSYVRNFFGERPGLACAYVLFYQETTLEAVEKEQAAEEAAAAKAASSEATKVPAQTAGKTNGTLLNGHALHHAHTVATTKVEESEPVATLTKVATEPLAPTPSAPAAPVSEKPSTVVPTLLSSKTFEVKSKKEKAKEEKEARALEKEREKAAKQELKEIQARRKELERQQKEDEKAAIAASKASKAEEDEKRAKDADKNKENGVLSAAGGLSRFRQSSKSMSGKNKFWGKDKSKDSTPKDVSRDSLYSQSTTTQESAVAEEDGGYAPIKGPTSAPATTVPQSVPVAKEKEKKNRFSGLKKKASILY